QAGADQCFRQEWCGGNGEGDRGAWRGDPFDRRNGQNITGGGDQGHGRGCLYWLTGNSGRPGEDASSQDSWRLTGATFGACPCRADGTAGDWTDRCGRGQPLSVRGDDRQTPLFL